MMLGDLINGYGRKYSPYVRRLVNHLPMGQLATYKITGDIKKVERFSENFVSRSNINPIKTTYPKVSALDDCLGKRDLYESCLEIIKNEIQIKGVYHTTTDILNTYPLGLSSGLFHTLIRVAYAIEGLELDPTLDEEVARALAYYVSAYRKTKILKEKIDPNNLFDGMNQLVKNAYLREILDSEETLGSKMRALYNDEEYLNTGFVLEGAEYDKIVALIKFLTATYINTGSIIVLHCITGLHALIVLKNYFEDWDNAIDILTSSIVTHLLSTDNLIYCDTKRDELEFSWEYIFSKLSVESDVHAIKFSYTCNELYKLYKIPELKDAARKRITHR